MGTLHLRCTSLAFPLQGPLTSSAMLTCSWCSTSRHSSLLSHYQFCRPSSATCSGTAGSRLPNRLFITSRHLHFCHIPDGVLLFARHSALARRHGVARALPIRTVSGDRGDRGGYVEPAVSAAAQILSRDCSQCATAAATMFFHLVMPAEVELHPRHFGPTMRVTLEQKLTREVGDQLPPTDCHRTRHTQNQQTCATASQHLMTIVATWLPRHLMRSAR